MVSRAECDEILWRVWAALRDRDDVMDVEESRLTAECTWLEFVFALFAITKMHGVEHWCGDSLAILLGARPLPRWHAFPYLSVRFRITCTCKCERGWNGLRMNALRGFERIQDY